MAVSLALSLALSLAISVPAGWGFADIQRYFLRSEGNTVLSGDWHGTDGPLGVSNTPDPNPTTRAFVQSCQERGIPFNPDFNGAVQEGAGIYQTTTRNKRRCSLHWLWSANIIPVAIGLCPSIKMALCPNSLCG